MNWRFKCALLGVCVLLSRVGLAQHTVAEQYLFQSINAERAAAGLPALSWNPTLTQAARQHALTMHKSLPFDGAYLENGDPSSKGRCVPTIFTSFRRDCSIEQLIDKGIERMRNFFAGLA